MEQYCCPNCNTPLLVNSYIDGGMIKFIGYHCKHCGYNIPLPKPLTEE